MKLKIDNLTELAPVFKHSMVYGLINHVITDNDITDYGLNYLKIYSK